MYMSGQVQMRRQIRRRGDGEKVYPSEVEQVLAGHPDVGDVAVIGVPDPK